MDANRNVFDNVAEFYDTYRPYPPAELTGLLIQMAEIAVPALVVDLGSGTGLSTVNWVGRAKNVIGIEPNADMLRVAHRRVRAMQVSAQLSFQEGIGSQTGLPDACADIVTCSQSFHWMEPHSTLAEIARILRPGGIFAAYDYQWPPTLGWQAEMAFETFIERAWAIMKQRDLNQDIQVWTQNRELLVLKECGHFRYVKELWLHHQEMGNADRLVGLALTNGVVQFLQKGQLSEEEIGLAEFRKTAEEAIGSTPVPWYFSYHVRIGIK